MNNLLEWAKGVRDAGQSHYSTLTGTSDAEGDASDEDGRKRSVVQTVLRRRRGRKRKKTIVIPALSEKYESLDYELIENEIQRKEEASLQNYALVAARNRKGNVADRWIVCFLIGFLTAVIGFVVYAAVRGGMLLKHNFLSSKMEACVVDGCMASVFGYWILINAAISAVPALLCVFISPAAVGSGIPQIKCFLNGIKVPKLLRLSTLFSKIVGVVGSVLGGLAVGKEGPMAHAGACVAGGVSQGRSLTVPLDFKMFEYFRSDREKRDFVSAGTAAGVAAAFNAPIGGVLFSMEEGASFWTQIVTWRTFFCSMSCYFFLNVFLSTLYGDEVGVLSWNGLANFGRLHEDTEYALWEIPVFLVMGVIGGLTGALFNGLNSRITIFRLTYLKSKIGRLLEVLIIASLSAVFNIIMIYSTQHCTPINTFRTHFPLLHTPIQLYCPAGHINEIASVMFDAPETAVRWFFHYPERKSSEGFDVSALLLFVPLFWLLSCITYGISVPSGVFIPLILIGAGWGRLFARAMQLIVPSTHILKVSTKYAIIGAGAQLSGTLRMTISICVILMESVQSLRIGLPLMLTMVVGKWVGDQFNKGLYDSHIDILEIPILGWQPPETSTTVPAKKVMSTPVNVVRTKEKVSVILDILKTDSHHGYPVVTDFNPEEERRGKFNIWVQLQTDSWDYPTNFGQLEGMIMRHQLIVLLHHRAFAPSWATQLNIVDAEPVLSAEAFRDPYPRYGDTLQKLRFTPEDLNSWVDMRPYMDPSPYIATEDASLRKLFRLCRRLGLRHIVVVNKEHRVLGIVTRKDVARYRESVDKKHNILRIREMYISGENS